jgi:hypothetical protein
MSQLLAWRDKDKGNIILLLRPHIIFTGVTKTVEISPSCVTQIAYYLYWCNKRQWKYPLLV